MPEEKRPRFGGFERIVLLVLAIAVIAMAAFIFCGMNQIKSALQESAQTNRDAIASSQRAYIYVTGTEIVAPSAANGEQAQFLPKWENGGNTPANPVFIEIRCPVKLEKPQDVPQKTFDTPEGQSLAAPPQPITRLRAMFAPKQSTPIGACIFNKQQVALLLPYKPHVFLAVRAAYRDVFGAQMHITEYCSDNAITGSADGKLAYQSTLCPDYNCVDVQCPAEDIKEMEQEYFKPQSAANEPKPASP